MRLLSPLLMALGFTCCSIIYLSFFEEWVTGAEPVKPVVGLQKSFWQETDEHKKFSKFQDPKFWRGLAIERKLADRVLLLNNAVDGAKNPSAVTRIRLLNSTKQSTFYVPPVKVVGQYLSRESPEDISVACRVTAALHGHKMSPMKALNLWKLSGPSLVQGARSGSGRDVCMGTIFFPSASDGKVTAVQLSPLCQNFSTWYGNKEILSVEKAFSLSRWNAQFPYHQYMEVIPRLIMAADLLRSDPSLRILQLSGCQNYKEAMDLLGIPRDRIVEYNPWTQAVLVQRELYFINAHPSELFRPTPEVVNSLRTLFPRSPQPRKIVILLVRRHDNRRRGLQPFMTMQEIVMAAARRKSSNFEAVTFRGSNISLSSQSLLWSRASIIISPHGADLANLAFARRGASVLEVFPDDPCLHSHFVSMSGFLQLRYHIMGIAGGSYDKPLILSKKHLQNIGQFVEAEVEHHSSRSPEQ